MKVEVVEFYLFKNDLERRILRGTMHIFLPELGLDIRGCLVFADKSKFYASLPHLNQIDENGDKQRFPVIGFLDLKKSDELKESFAKAAKEYIDQHKSSYLPKEAPPKKHTMPKKPFRAFPSKDNKRAETKVEPKVETVLGKKFVDLVPPKKKTW